MNECAYTNDEKRKEISVSFCNSLITFNYQKAKRERERENEKNFRTTNQHKNERK